jgi:hypothetical protein
MSLLRTLLPALLLGGASAALAAPPAEAPVDPDCRLSVGGTGGAHVIGEHCPERDLRIAAAVRATLEDAQRTPGITADRIESVACSSLA